LSILDGWFDEAFELSGGWAIGDRETYAEDQDAIHASAIYYLLENEIVPMFYERRDGGSPREWMKRMKQSIMYLTPQFDCRRMIQEYDLQLYAPAQDNSVRLRAANYQGARERARWNARVREVWDRVRFIDTGSPAPGPLLSGRPMGIRATLDLAGLAPDDVRVEVIIGRIGSNGCLEDTEVILAPLMEQDGMFTVFATEVTPAQTGRLGYALRISPNHCDDPLTRPCTALMNWAL